VVDLFTAFAPAVSRSVLHYNYFAGAVTTVKSCIEATCLFDKIAGPRFNHLVDEPLAWVVKNCCKTCTITEIITK
jgi:hypothetical protein